MPAVAYEAFRRKGVFAYPRVVVREIERTMDDRVKPKMISEHRKRVSNWESDVDFSARKFIRRDAIWLNVFPTGDDKMVWHYVNRGTRPHRIDAHSYFPRGLDEGPLLVFHWAGPGSYNAKTEPGDVYGQESSSTGPAVLIPWVNHPGNEPREFSRHIANDYDDEFKREIRNAIRRGKRQARRFR
jgi:hypothetical protein